MEKKQSVLIVHNYYQIPGGEDTVVANEKNLLEENGHKVILYTRNNSELKELTVLQKLLLPFSTIFNLRTYREVKKILVREKIDVMHVHNTLNMISPSVYYAAVACGVPVVQTMHNFRMLCPGAIFYRDGHICEECLQKGLGCAVKHRCYRGSLVQTLACVVSTMIHRWTGIYRKIHYICLTEFNKEKLLCLNNNRKKAIVSEDRVFIKPNFTYEALCNTASDREEDYFLYMGRLDKPKGIDLIVRAFAEHRNYKLRIAGMGAELDRLKAYVEENQLDNVSFLGFLNRERLNEELGGARAVIVASQWYETFGMIVIEAYAAHKPVIVGNVGNISTLVESGVTGLHFQYNDHRALGDALKRFESVDHREWGENAFGRFLSDYSPSVNYARLAEIYTAVCNKK